MSQKLKAQNAIMKTIGRKDAKEAFAKFKFQLTKAVLEAFEWDDVTGASEWTPDAPHDQFRCHFIELKPNNSEMAAHTMKIEASTIGDFQIQRKAQKDGKNAVKAKKVVTDVLCTVRFSIPTALATLESFKVNANKNSEMLIAFDPNPQQGEIDGSRVVAHTGEVINGRLSLVPDDVHATPEQQAAVTEEGPGQTHAERMKERKAAKARALAGESIQ